MGIDDFSKSTNKGTITYITSETTTIICLAVSVYEQAGIGFGRSIQNHNISYESGMTRSDIVRFDTNNGSWWWCCMVLYYVGICIIIIWWTWMRLVWLYGQWIRRVNIADCDKVINNNINNALHCYD